MKKKLQKLALFATAALIGQQAAAQITLVKNYSNNNSSTIGTFQGITFREGGFSGMYPVAGTNGKEFWICSDRGVNIDAASANPSTCRPTYDKIYAFPTYAPKIHRVRVNGDSVQILRTITIKRPDGTGATGIINPTGFGSTATEAASTDTVLDCANFSAKIAAKDIWGIDAEGIVVDKDGNFWVCEEGGPTIWKINRNGVVTSRFTPYANLTGAQSIDVQIDTAFKYRKNNRGFENIAIAPNGKIYALIQSPLLYPTTAIGEASRVHRMIEIDPATNATRMFAYLNDGVIGTGSNQIRLKDWKLGDMAAINDTTFLVLEAALRGTTDIKRLYKISINGATAVSSGLYGTSTLEGLVDSAGLAGKSIVPVKKTLVMDLLANGWPSALDKAEGLSILNDSTLFICNDNDYGQSSPAENGVATANANTCHIVEFRLSGANKLQNFVPANFPLLTAGITGPSTSVAPYLLPLQPGVQLTSMLTTPETVGGYTMCGTPDGLGAYDNNDGTFTLLMNHEFASTAGVVRAHGATGTFVSKWIINKNTLSVVSGEDLMKTLKLWTPATNSYTAYNSSFTSPLAALGRHCSGDLPEVSAYYNAATGKGTQERIFMNGEETGTEGRAFAYIATGTEAGTTYEIPNLGKYSFENAVACPTSGDTTVVIGLDDATPGQIYVYVGSKTTIGNDIERAGLTNGSLYGVAVSGLLSETNASIPAANTVFALAPLGDVKNTTGVTLNTNSDAAGVTRFLRPEDGSWDPSSPNDFYFTTTNSFASPSRLWRLRFTDITKPTLGGTITAVLDGTEGQKMLDNLTIDHYGHILLVEDVGVNAHLGRILQYDIAKDTLMQIGQHDSTRFLTGAAGYLTQDEEASGIIDVQAILGPGMFLLDDQAHYAISGQAVEGGQMLALYNPLAAKDNPEISVLGNNRAIAYGSTTTDSLNNTHFGNINRGTTSSKNIVVKNAGPGALKVTGVNITGTNASEFVLTSAPTFPLMINANDSLVLTLSFTPLSVGTRTASVTVSNNDFDESKYMFAVSGNSVIPEIEVKGNNTTIINGDMTPGTTNNTDFGITNLTSSTTKVFTIKNRDLGTLSVSGITFTGANASEFTLTTTPTYPLAIAANDSTNISVKFTPTAASIRTAVINIACNDDDEANYTFAIEGTGKDATSVATTSGSSLVKLYPNPTGDAATVELTLLRNDHVAINIVSIDGKTAIQAHSQDMKAGEHKINIATSSLPNGTYFVNIITATMATKVKMVVMH